MPTFDATSAECLVLTYKEGLLSAVAHDLKIRAERLELEVDWEAPSVRATFDPSSLRVVCAMQDGRDAPSLLSDKDRRKIEKNIVDDVLHPKRHGEIRFVSDSVDRVDGRARIRGKLTLHGETRELSFDAEKKDEGWVAEARLHQPDFGITPYTAAFGTLRIKPHVDVHLRIPSEG